MTTEQKQKIAALYRDWDRQACDPNWRPGQAEATHKLWGLEAALGILGYRVERRYQGMGMDDEYVVRVDHHARVR